MEEIFINELAALAEDEVESAFSKEPTTLPPWVTKELEKKTHVNYSLLFLHRLFNNQKILITDYDLVTVGIDSSGKKAHRVFRILSSAHTVLIGPHTIQFNGSIFTVTSLRALKKHFFDFNDVTSFERSTFLIHPERKIIIRLKNIRSFLYCRISQMELGMSSPGNEVKLVHKEKRSTRSNSFVIQRHMDTIVSFYQKQSPEAPIQDILDRVQFEVFLFIDTEKEQYNKLT